LSDRLFVYGTLKADQAQSALLGDLPRQLASVAGTLYDLPAGYPALVLHPGGNGERRWVWGELVGPVDQRLLELIDLYEGVSQGLYRRVTADVRVGLRTVGAWTYVMDPGLARQGRVVATGRWRPIRRR
jgi:gamma-glutamylcyclotransferase (GGCT)/AIG2-like uncharacterized protein YtfP